MSLHSPPCTNIEYTLPPPTQSATHGSFFLRTRSSVVLDRCPALSTVAGRCSAISRLASDRTKMTQQKWALDLLFLRSMFKKRSALNCQGGNGHCCGHPPPAPPPPWLEELVDAHPPTRPLSPLLERRTWMCAAPVALCSGASLFRADEAVVKACTLSTHKTDQVNFYDLYMSG